MISFTNEVVISQPVEQVFSFVAQLENLPLWNYFVTEVRQKSGEGTHPGAVFLLQRKTDAQELQVLACQPDRVLEIATRGAGPYFHRRLTFAPTSQGTRVRDDWELGDGWIPLPSIGRFFVKRAVASNLEKLKELLERGRTQLQDGRTVFLPP